MTQRNLQGIDEVPEMSADAKLFIDTLATGFVVLVGLITAIVTITFTVLTRSMQSE